MEKNYLRLFIGVFIVILIIFITILYVGFNKSAEAKVETELDSYLAPTINSSDKEIYDYFESVDPLRTGLFEDSRNYVFPERRISVVNDSLDGYLFVMKNYNSMQNNYNYKIHLLDEELFNCGIDSESVDKFLNIEKEGNFSLLNSTDMFIMRIFINNDLIPSGNCSIRYFIDVFSDGKPYVRDSFEIKLSL